MKIRPETPGVWAKNLINLLPSLGLRTRKCAGASSLRVPTGGVIRPSRRRLQPGLKLWYPPPPKPKEEVFKVVRTCMVYEIPVQLTEEPMTLIRHFNVNCHEVSLKEHK